MMAFKLGCELQLKCLSFRLVREGLRGGLNMEIRTFGCLQGNCQMVGSRCVHLASIRISDI